MTVRKYSNLSKLNLRLNSNQVILFLLMNALISVGPSVVTVLKPVLTTKPVLISVTRTSTNAQILVPVRQNVQLVVTNVLRRFVNVEIRILVLII